jgi:hypothetical protein
MDVAIIILSLPVYEADAPIILDHSVIRNDGEFDKTIYSRRTTDQHYLILL